MTEDETKSLKASVAYLKRRIVDLELASHNKLCSKCSEEVRKHQRVKEDRMFDLLVNSGFGPCSRNKKCAGYRPDFVLDGGTHFVVVEVDEHQHKSYTENKDERMISVRRALELPTTFVRFNPSNYRPGDDSREANDYEREEVLIAWVKKLLNQEVPRVSDPQVIYLFFDGFVNGKENVCEIVENVESHPSIPEQNKIETVIEKIMTGSRAPLGEDGYWEMYAKKYKAGWGLDKLDDSFIRDHGVRHTCPMVSLLISLIYIDIPYISGRKTSATCRLKIRTSLLIEVIAALGFASPFDTSHRITDLMALWEDKLKKTNYFSKYKQYSKLFGCAGKTSAWTLQTVSKALGTLFGAIGLHLNSIRIQRRDKGVKKNYYVYNIDPAKCSEMLELVRIKMRCSEFRSATPNKQARELLLTDDYPKYGHLLDLEKRTLSDSDE
jgi:hypothetical protein